MHCRRWSQAETLKQEIFVLPRASCRGLSLTGISRSKLPYRDVPLTTSTSIVPNSSCSLGYYAPILHQYLVFTACPSLNTDHVDLCSKPRPIGTPPAFALHPPEQHPSIPYLTPHKAQRPNRIFLI